jgi:hypothetical protein
MHILLGGHPRGHQLGYFDTTQGTFWPGSDTNLWYTSYAGVLGGSPEDIAWVNFALSGVLEGPR